MADDNTPAAGPFAASKSAGLDVRSLFPTADEIVGQAKSLPHLIELAKAADPALAEQLTGKALIASKSVWGPAASMVVSWAVAKWGLGWDSDTCSAVAGGVALFASAAARALTSGPITGIFKAK